LFAVFDGHGGKEVAEFCSREVTKTLEALDSYTSKDYETALRECFISLDTQLSQLEGQNKIVAISKEI
jgi:serine/threonine protein phosphatase PrpC